MIGTISMSAICIEFLSYREESVLWNLVQKLKSNLLQLLERFIAPFLLSAFRQHLVFLIGLYTYYIRTKVGRGV